LGLVGSDTGVFIRLVFSVPLFNARIRERAMLRRVTLYDFEKGAALR